MKEYKCKNCWYEWVGYWIPTSEWVTAPICKECQRNNMLEEIKD